MAEQLMGKDIDRSGHHLY